MINKIFYSLKPLIPRRIQILLRRRLITYRRRKFSGIWPIDPNAGAAPQNWPGWPDGKKFALVLSHDVDTWRGHDNCRKLIDLEKKLGFRSMINLVPERYPVSAALRKEIALSGMELGLHGLKHDGKLFFSEKVFMERAVRINQYLKEWGVRGFTSPSTHHNLNWMHALNIDYDISTFDTDPFEPQPDGMGTIFPFVVFKGESRLSNPKPLGNAQLGLSSRKAKISTTGIHEVFRGLKCESDAEIESKGALDKGFVELPYTLPQDFTLFILMQEKSIDIWKRKLDWIAEKGGMALLNTHPDYMSFNHSDGGDETYPVKFYTEFLEYIKDRYSDKYWHALPGEVAAFLRQDQSSFAKGFAAPCRINKIKLK